MLPSIPSAQKSRGRGERGEKGEHWSEAGEFESRVVGGSRAEGRQGGGKDYHAPPVRVKRLSEVGFWLRGLPAGAFL